MRRSTAGMSAMDMYQGKRAMQLLVALMPNRQVRMMAMAASRPIFFIST